MRSMALKRSSSEAGFEAVRTSRPSSKRTHKIPSGKDRSDASTRSVSDVSATATALERSPVASAETAATSTSSVSTSTPSVNSSHSDSDGSSSSSGDNDGEADESDPERNDRVRNKIEPEVITLRAPTSHRKPPIDSARVQIYAKELQARLEEFMPKLRQANSELATRGNGLNIEDVGEDEQHIEMNLGLGVLEQKTCGGERSDGGILTKKRDQKEESDGGSDDGEEKDEEEGNVLSRLLNANRSNQGKVGIQEIAALEGE